MTQTPPIPAGNQSPYPTQEPPHTSSSPSGQATGQTSAQAGDTLNAGIASAKDAVGQGVATAKDAVGPLAEKATQFVKDRPWTAAALIGTIALATLNTLRGKKA